MNDVKTIVVVGGGLVGALTAAKFKKQSPPGTQVLLFEQRADLRNANVNGRGRSINLALSDRGIAALKSVMGPEKFESIIRKSIVPMYGRMLHRADGKLEMVPYSHHQWQCINSIDRLMLNRILLDEAEEAGVKLHFQHSLKEAHLDSDTVIFSNQLDDGEDLTVKYDLCIGADGAYSSMRRELMKRNRMNYAQEYIQHGYIELTVEAKSLAGSDETEYKMHSNSLHIWPRHSFMMIALPNTDKSFTLTLFMPFDKFDSIKTDAELFAFFEEHFPDSIPLIGRELLRELFFQNPIGPLITVKCTPYHYKNAAIIGDASHAMVPFYGQGMNCGFEDVLVLESCLFGVHEYLPNESQPSIPNLEKMTVEERLKQYTEFRHEDAVAMCDLALYNYYEMRSNVLSPVYRVRKTVEGWLNRLMPNTVIPLYSMVSFSQIRYSRVIQQWHRQSRWLMRATAVSVLGLVAGAFVLGKKLISVK